MKKGILMTLVAVAAAAVGLVVAVMTALRHDKMTTVDEVYIDDEEFFEDDFDIDDESDFENTEEDFEDNVKDSDKEDTEENSEN